MRISRLLLLVMISVLPANAQVRRDGDVPTCDAAGKSPGPSGPQVVGRVTRSDNGDPIAGVKVDFSDGSSADWSNRQSDRCVPTAITDSTGSYSMEGLADGTYMGSAFADGYVTGDYNCVPGPAGACHDRGLQVRPDSHLRIDFALEPGATIRGVVKTPDGNAVGAGAEVVAVPTVYLKQTKAGGVYSVWGRAITDAQGTFALKGMAASEYVLRVHQMVGGVKDDVGPWYGEVWYGGTSGPTGAKPIELKVAEQYGPIEIIVHPEQRYRLTLAVDGPPGVPTPREYIISTADSNMTARKQNDGTYVMRNMAPGHYQLLIHDVPIRPGFHGYTIEVDMPNRDVTLPIHLGSM
jgi:hypothetical protein